MAVPFSVARLLCCGVQVITAPRLTILGTKLADGVPLPIGIHYIGSDALQQVEEEF